ncbi:hypothetical protein SAMN02949497_1938 [Methylomagnum ishizawai]|uniref:Uncharacterized protein n=1 Tax=Methylomagnum ishizawai TaxID=1760988 RepID=A0A1Y6CWA6_9GAMM|nr:hypothetical protein [Methylomagnum ishizawai]SMF94617.1 hypothetical protein SAMN02949497_1938 [Methylomagnum ishizawai]
MCGDGGGTKQEFAQSARFAGVARNLWDDYQQRFAPVQRTLANTLLMDGLDANRQADAAADTVGKAFDAQRAGFDLDSSRRGLVLTPEQRTAADRQFDLGRASALVANRNAVRQGVLDTDTALVGGGTLSSAGRGIQMGG